MHEKFLGLFKNISERIKNGISCRPVGKNSKGQITKYFDKSVENQIISFLKKNFKYPAVIISEERKKSVCNPGTGKNYTIIVDPVDGSDNYVNGVPFVCMGLAVFSPYGRPFMSFCGNYYSGEYFYADSKCFYEGFKRVENKEQSLLFTFSKTSGEVCMKLPEIIENYKNVRSYGATVGELILVLKGSFSAFVDIRGTLTLENFAPFFIAEMHGKMKLQSPDGGKINVPDYDLSRGYRILAAASKKKMEKIRRLL